MILINKLPALGKWKQPHLFDLLPLALSNVPFHQDTAAVTRYVAENFPVHLAVHEISPVLLPPLEYTQPHIHEDFDEVNIVISRQALLYKIQLGDEIYTVKNNSAVWIPKGMVHAANVLQGSGFFITLRLN